MGQLGSFLRLGKLNLKLVFSSLESKVFHSQTDLVLLKESKVLKDKSLKT